MAFRARRLGLIALLLAVTVSVGWTITALRNTSPVTLQACMESESGPRARVCRQALYHLHPTQEEVVELNASAGAQYPVLMPDRNEATRLLQHYLRAGVDINAIDTRSPLKWTALHTATFEGNPQAVRLLLDNGADARIKDSMGRTPLDIAHDALSKVPSGGFGQIVSMLAENSSNESR